MNDNQFYLVLPSNVKTIDNTSNKTSHYTTHLPSSLVLDRSWEVALMEISYPHSWNEDLDPSLCWYQTLKVKQGAVDVTTNYCEKNKKSYVSIRSLVKGLNEIKPKSFEGFFKASGEKQVEIHLAEFEGIHMTKMLADILGFTKQRYLYSDVSENIILGEWIIYAENMSDFRQNLNNLFVYSDLVQPSLVGDIMTPLLRTVPVSDENKNKYITKSFEIPRYLPLNTHFLQKIEIYVTNDIGEKVKFQWGKIIVQLHFRKKKRELQ